LACYKKKPQKPLEPCKNSWVPKTGKKMGLQTAQGGRGEGLELRGGHGVGIRKKCWVWERGGGPQVNKKTQQIKKQNQTLSSSSGGIMRGQKYVPRASALLNLVWDKRGGRDVKTYMGEHQEANNRGGPQKTRSNAWANSTSSLTSRRKKDRRGGDRGETIRV